MVFVYHKALGRLFAAFRLWGVGKRVSSEDDALDEKQKQKVAMCFKRQRGHIQFIINSYLTFEDLNPALPLHPLHPQSDTSRIYLITLPICDELFAVTRETVVGESSNFEL